MNQNNTLIDLNLSGNRWRCIKYLPIGFILLSSFLVSCHEEKSQRNNLISDDQKEGNIVENTEQSETKNTSVKKVISTREALERLQSYGILGSFENMKISNEIISHYNRYINGDESLNDFPYIAKILSLKGKIPKSCIESFIQEGADVNLITRDYNIPPLYATTSAENAEIVKLLLEHKADPNSKDSDDSTSLFCAVDNCNVKIAKLLLEHNADPNVKNSYDNTPLFRAVDRCNVEIVKLLLEHKADPNSKGRMFDYGVVSSLHRAVDKCNVEIVKLLLEHKANPNTEDATLHKAVDNGNVEIVKLLLEHKADPNVKDSYGKTPLFRAADSPSSDNVEIVKLLLEHKADPNVKDNEGETPLDRANFNSSRESRVSIIGLLKQAMN